MSIFNNDKGFFQGNGQGGIKFDLGAGFENLKRKTADKPCAGVAGVCPYTCKPLSTPQEQAEGISAEAKAQGKPPEGAMQAENIGQNAITGRNIMASPQGLSNPAVQAQLADKENLINSMGGLGALSGTGALQGQNALRMRRMAI